MVAVCDIAGASDQVLQRKISSRLADTNRPSLKSLAVQVAGDCVTLRGSVGTFYEKQIAIQACRGLVGSARMIDAADVAVAN
jgi:osmotically-inducible protein OsmY